MRVIYKYALALRDYQNVRLPKKSVILTAQEQDGVLVLWAIVDMAEHQEDVEVRIVGTGNPFPNDMLDGYRHLSTVQESRRPLVWHVFVKDGR